MNSIRNANENLLNIDWKSDENHMKIKWKPNENKLKIKFKSNEHQLKIKWKSHEHQLKIVWKSYEDQMKSTFHCSRPNGYANQNSNSIIYWKRTHSPSKSNKHPTSYRHTPMEPIQWGNMQCMSNDSPTNFQI